MRLCYWITIALLCVLPVYYGRQYDSSNQDSMAPEAKAQEAQNLPAIWRPPPYEKDVFGTPGISIYVQRKQRGWFDFAYNGWEWLKSNGKAILSATRLTLDILSTVLGVVRVFANMFNFLTFGLSGMALSVISAGFDIVHGAVGLADLHYNNGTVHPDLGGAGRFLQSVANVCSYVDTALVFVDIGSLMKKAVRKIVDNKDKILRFGIRALNKIKSAGAKIAKMAGKLKKTGVKRVLGAGRRMFNRGKRTARRAIQGTQGVVKRAGGVMRDLRSLTKQGKYRGAVSQMFKTMKQVSAKFRSSNVLRGSLEVTQKIIRLVNPRNLKLAAKGLYELSEIVTPGRLKHILRVIDWISFGATNTTDAQNFLGNLQYGFSLVKGPFALKNALRAYKDHKLVKNMLIELKSGQRVVMKANDLKNLQKMLMGIRGGRGKREGEEKEEDVPLEMLLELSENVDSIDNLREYLRVQLEMLKVFEHLEFIDPVVRIYEGILEVQEDVQDDDKIKEILQKMSGFIGILPKSELSHFIGQIDFMSVALEREGEIATATDVISLITAMDKGLSNVNLTDTMGFLHANSEEIWSDGGPTEFLEGVESFVKSVEGVEEKPTLFSTLLEAEIGFSETKALLRCLLEISQISKRTREFQAFLTAMAEQLTSGADPGAMSRRIESLEVLMKHPEASRLQELFETMLNKTASLPSLKAILDGFGDPIPVKKYHIKLSDLRTIFRILSASEGLETSGELYDVLNQIGIFTGSIKLQSFYRKISSFIRKIDHNPDVFESWHGLPENITTHQFLKSLSSISRCKEILKDSGNSGALPTLLPSLFNISKAVLNIGNVTKILGVIGEVGKLKLGDSELLKVVEHFEKSLNSSSSLDELRGVYQVVVDKLIIHKEAPSLLVKLVNNLHWHKESFHLVDFLYQIISSSNQLEMLSEHLRIFITPTDDFDDLEDLTRTFANFTFTPDNVKLFELIASGSKTIADFHKVIGALRVLTLNSKQKSLKFFKLSDDLVDQIQSWKQLHKVLSYLGTAPEDVKSMAHSGDFIDGISEIVQDCIVQHERSAISGVQRSFEDAELARECTELATSAFFNMSNDDSGSIRRQLEAHERIAENAQDSETLHQMFSATTLGFEDTSTEVFLKTSEFIGGWVKAETGDVMNTANAMGTALTAIAERSSARHRRSPDTGFRDVIQPLLKNLGVSPFGIENAEDFAKIEELVKGLDDPEKDLQDIQQCSSAFERLGDGEKVREFFQVAETFNYSDASLGALSESVVSIGDPKNVQDIPELVREVKSCPDAQEQVADMAKLIPGLTGLPTGLQGLTEPLMKLGVNDTMQFLNGSRAEILEKLRQEPGLGAHLKELVESLYALDPQALGIIGKGSFNRNSSITTRISTFLGNISTTRPILGLSNLSRTSRSLENGTGTLENLDQVMGSMGNVSEALDTVRDLPVVMKMPGCRDNKVQRKIQDTLDSLSAADNEENILAISALEHIGEMYQNLSSGPETFEKMAEHLEPLSQLPGGLKQFKEVLDDVEPDSEALQTLAPSLEAIHGATNGSDVLEVIGQLEAVHGELQVLTELSDQIPEILEKVGVLVGVTTKRPSTSTVVYSSTPPTVTPEALIAGISCALRKDSGALMTCEGYCSVLKGDGSSAHKLWTTILAITAAVMLLIALGLLIWMKPRASPASNDVEMTFSRAGSFSEQETGSGSEFRGSGALKPSPKTPKPPKTKKKSEKNSIHNLTKPKLQKGPNRDPLKSPTDSTESRPTTPARTPISPIHPKVQKLWK